jgi:hypothetical protein
METGGNRERDKRQTRETEKETREQRGPSSKEDKREQTSDERLEPAARLSAES